LGAEPSTPTWSQNRAGPRRSIIAARWDSSSGEGEGRGLLSVCPRHHRPAVAGSARLVDHPPARICGADFTMEMLRVAASRAIVQAWTDASARGVAAFAMPDGQFVDEPVVRRARAVVALAASLEKGPDHG